MASDKVEVVRYEDLTPSWELHRAKEPGLLRWQVQWVGGAPPSFNTNPGESLVSDKFGCGYWVLLEGNQSAYHIHTVDEIYLVIEGKIVVHGEGYRHVLGPLDAALCPAGVVHGIINVGRGEARLIWFHAGIEHPDTIEHPEK